MGDVGHGGSSTGCTEQWWVYDGHRSGTMQCTGKCTQCDLARIQYNELAASILKKQLPFVALFLDLWHCIFGCHLLFCVFLWFLAFSIFTFVLCICIVSHA